MLFAAETIQNPLGAVVVGGLLLAHAVQVYRKGFPVFRWADREPRRDGFAWWSTWAIGGGLAALALIGGLVGLLLELFGG